MSHGSVNSLTKKTIKLRGMALVLASMLSAGASAEIVERTFCVWDPVGAGGPVVNLIKGAVTKAIGWGVQLKLDVYTDEKVAANDFKAGKCAGAMMTDVSVRDFNQFTSTFNAVGAIPGNEELRTILTTISSPKAAKLMREGHYEIAGILPIGSVFIYVRDKKIDSVEAFQGKKMAVLNNDPVAAQMVRRVGGSVVNSSLTSFSGQFNNGSVDIIFAPAVAFNTMELYKGLDSGGILDYPLLHTSLQIVIRHDQFPEGFGQHLRDYSLSMTDEMLEVVAKAESEIPPHFWIGIAEDVKGNYSEYMRQSRIALKGEGYYEPKALKLMKKVRCKYSPTAGECVQNDE